MATLPASTARRHFTRLLERVAQGEAITITRRGQPIAKLEPLNAKRNGAKDSVGRLKGYHLGRQGLPVRPLPEERG